MNENSELISISYRQLVQISNSISLRRIVSVIDMISYGWKLLTWTAPFSAGPE